MVNCIRIKFYILWVAWGNMVSSFVWWGIGAAGIVVLFIGWKIEGMILKAVGLGLVLLILAVLAGAWDLFF